jgi:hypothetical protein
VSAADIWIQWVWRARRPDERNIGFGVHRRRFQWGSLAVVAALLLSTSLFLMKAPSHVLLWTGIGAMAVTMAAIRANGRHYRYYEVDNRARVIQALSDTPPPEILRRRPASRRRFLRAGTPD